MGREIFTVRLAAAMRSHSGGYIAGQAGPLHSASAVPRLELGAAPKPACGLVPRPSGVKSERSDCISSLPAWQAPYLVLARDLESQTGYRELETMY